MNEYLYLQQLFAGFGGGNLGWLTIALLIVLSLACLFKPERIQSRNLFRWAIGFLFIAIIAPTIAQLILLAIEVPLPGGRRGSSPELGMTYAIQSALRPCCLGLSILCLFGAIAPRKQGTVTAAIATEKSHPLDD